MATRNEESKQSNYGRGENPASQANLQPRQPTYGSGKKVRRPTITDEGWLGLGALASEFGAASISELLEKIGRKEIILILPSQ